VTCTVHAGSGEDTGTLDLYLTENSIIDSIGESGRYKTGAPTTEMLERLDEGGDSIMNRQFEYYMVPENVVLLATFDTS